MGDALPIGEASPEARPPAPPPAPGRGRRVVVVGVGLLAAGIAGLAGIGWRAYDAPGPAAASRLVVIARGSSLDAIAAKIVEDGVLDRRWPFVFGARVLGRAASLKAGEYEIPPSASARAIVDLLVSGRTYQRRLTVPEGLTTTQVLALVGAAEALDGEVPERVGEGELLPDTYAYRHGDSRAAVVRRMAAEMQRVLAELWPGRAAGLPIETAYQAVILASIVEKETGIGAERARVAAVFLNRLKRGMKLDADPTVIYALTRGAGPLERDLSRADLALDDPYNTYRQPGLPPGPIACPGRAAIEAVLHPAATDDLYFVADGSGGHVFAKTLEEHARNVQRLRQRERDKDG